MQDLAPLVHLSQSALSRTVGRLEKDGLVNRTMCPEDRRGGLGGDHGARRTRTAIRRQRAATIRARGALWAQVSQVYGAGCLTPWDERPHTR